MTFSSPEDRPPFSGSDSQQVANEPRLTGRIFPYYRPTLPFRIMLTASIPCTVRQALRNGAIALGEAGAAFDASVVVLACSTMLLRYLH